MKVAVTLVVALSASTLVLGSPVANAVGPTGSVVGAGWNAANELITVAAFATSTGVSGHASSRVLDDQGNLVRWVSGPVTCYSQRGAHAALFAIKIEQSAGYDSNLPPVNTAFVFSVEDNGRPGVDDAPDILGTGFFEAPQTDCSEIPFGGSTPFISGDIRITS